jgi:hypothetical protein
MPVSLDVLTGPRLKVDRAHRHIDELIELTKPLSRDLHVVRIEHNVGPTPDFIAPFSLVYRPMKPIPETLALIIGDTLHNLRSALDHLATGIVRTLDERAKVHFPMRKARADFLTDPVIARIEHVLPGAVETFANEVRPEAGAYEPLWNFHALDNDDKHNLLIPTVTVASVQNINAKFGTVSITNGTIGSDAAKPFFLIGSNTPITIEQDFETVVEVRFGPGKAFEDEPVVPTLTQTAQMVSETINAFERLIGRA